MIFVNSKKLPNPKESAYWVDTEENPYGGVIKYYDGHLERWVYLEEPIFELSAARKITNHHLTVLDQFGEIPEYTNNLLLQIDNLNEVKADKTDVLTKEDAGLIHDGLLTKINANSDLITSETNALRNRLEETVSTHTEDITELTAMVNTADSELRSAVASKASYLYVGESIKALTGVAPDVLNTLEELATALGNDPNFATTVTEMIADKTTQEDVLEIIYDLWENKLLAETDPTVPAWAKKSTKPTYTASEVGALPASTVVPQLTSQLTNDAGFLTQLEVNALIQANKPLSDSQYFKINKTDSYIVYNITEDSISLPIQYDTVVINVPEDITTLNVFFFEEPVVGSKFRIYINNKSSLTVTFYTLQNEVLHTVVIPAITRFDITAIDLTDYLLTTETDNIITTENGSTVVVNVLDGYIIDYVNMLNDLTWYEGE